MNNNKIKDIVNSPKDYRLIEDDLLDMGVLSVQHKDQLENDIFFEIIGAKSDGNNEISEDQKQNIIESLKSIREMLSEEQNNKLDRVLKLMDMQDV